MELSLFLNSQRRLHNLNYIWNLCITIWAQGQRQITLTSYGTNGTTLIVKSLAQLMTDLAIMALDNNEDFELPKMGLPAGTNNICLVKH